MKFVRDGVTIHFEDEGRGQPVIWAHPFPFDHRIWDPQSRALKSGYRIIRPDLRGFGGSSKPPGPYAVETHADDLAALLDHLELKNAVWAGLSMGGYVCLAALERHPSKVEGLIFAGSRTLADSPETRRTRGINAAKIRGGGFEEFIAGMPRRLLGESTLAAKPGEAAWVLDRIREQDPRCVAWALEGMGSRPDRSSLLTSWPGPVLLAHGREDAFVPLAEAQATAALLRRGKGLWVPGSGHLVNHEQPGIFNDAVKEWLGANFGTMTP